MKLPSILLAITLPAILQAEDDQLEPIFNGKNLDNWKTDDALVASHWLVSDSQIIGDNRDKKGSVLWTKSDYKDYELTVDYQTDSIDYDSGVFVRGPSHQIQIGVSRSLKIDLTGCIYCPKDLQGKYPNQSKKVSSAHKLGEWNHLKIRVVGHRIETHLNGELINDYMSVTMPKEGPIGLQVHAGLHQKILFKNFDLQPATYHEPKTVDPKYDGRPVPAPEGAMTLFDGRDLSLWKGTPRKGVENPNGEVRWKIENGYMQVSPKQGGITLKESLLTSGLLHLEWATPTEVVGTGQGRGNSGVFIGGFPEVQVLDSYDNKTYFDGQASALYKHAPPLVNASRGPGEWQKYEIHFTRAQLDDKGKVSKPAYLTVYHNGILTQDRVPFHNRAQNGGLSFQDHNNPVRFRNVWFMPKD